MSLCIRGALKNWSDRNFKGMFKTDDGHTMTPSEAKDELLEHLSKGHEVIPFGTCDNFDYAGGGCLGHVTTTDAAEGAQP